MRRCAPVLAALAASLTACGGESGDLLAVEVSGGPSAERTIVITNDGRGHCDGGELRSIASERLIEAREIERDLEQLVEEDASFGGSAARGGREYVARLRAGTVRWGEGEPGRPAVLPRLELLTLRLGRELCAEGSRQPQG